jgi:hypothetical protein
MSRPYPLPCSVSPTFYRAHVIRAKDARAGQDRTDGKRLEPSAVGIVFRSFSLIVMLLLALVKLRPTCSGLGRFGPTHTKSSSVRGPRCQGGQSSGFLEAADSARISVMRLAPSM